MKPKKNEEVQTPQAVPDLEIPETETPPSASPDLPDMTENAEKPMEPPSAEIIPTSGQTSSDETQTGKAPAFIF